MKKYLILGLLLLVFSVGVGVVLAAKPDFQPATVANPVTGQAKHTVVIPSTAIEVAPNIYYLGQAVDNGKMVEGYAFLDYKKGYVKPAGVGKPKPSDPAGSCYGFLASGARWKATESYVVANDIDALAVARDFETWDGQVAFDVFGNQDTVSLADGADLVSPDGKNEAMWGSISEPGVIAVTVVWGVFSGRPSWRYLAEYDVVFDNVDFLWGDAMVDPTLMDFENIATHEFGHAAGMADLYQTQCSEQTMYGYANFGETKKRDLEVGDVNGIKALYK